MNKLFTALFLFLALVGLSTAQTPAASAPGGHIQPNTRVFIHPMDGFETYLAAAILKKKVPLIVTSDKEKADYILSGNSEVQKAGWAKTIFISGASHANASVVMKDAKTGDLVFAYSVDKLNAARAQQSTAEACAKHLKSAIGK